MYSVRGKLSLDDILKEQIQEIAVEAKLAGDPVPVFTAGRVLYEAIKKPKRPKKPKKKIIKLIHKVNKKSVRGFPKKSARKKRTVTRK